MKNMDIAGRLKEALAEIGFECIGATIFENSSLDNYSCFKGSFDGNQHILYNLKIKKKLMFQINIPE